VQFLSARCESREVSQKLAREMKWYDAYLEQGGADISANPSPGNRAGGLSNIMEKTMGSIAKSGNAPIVEVLSPGEHPVREGLGFAATPASDFVCGPLQLASGITLQVFMTGRGTPYGLAAAPVIKVSSRTDMKNLWEDLIDVNAGTIAEGKETIPELGERLFRMIVDTASGVYRPWAEKYRLHNDICLFDPAPLT
jgi:galactarate dehydratase